MTPVSPPVFDAVFRTRLTALIEWRRDVRRLSDRSTKQGFGLGRHTMPEMPEYSTVASVVTFWLSARAAGLGVGWVSILDPDQVGALLDAPPSWKFAAYLCAGWPEEEHPDPELERSGWQKRTNAGQAARIVWSVAFVAFLPFRRGRAPANQGHRSA